MAVSGSSSGASISNGPRPGPRPTKSSTSSNQLLIVGLVGCAAIVVVVVISMRLLQHDPPPPPPPPLPTAERSVNAVLRYTPGYFKALIDDDAKRYGITPAPSIDELSRPLVYGDELAAPRRLRGKGDKTATAHLSVATKVVKEWASTSTGERFRFEHLVLTITNLTNRPLAYRVQTSVDHPEHCGSKGSLAHNAIALGAGETVERTECLWHPGDMLNVNKVETLTLTPLGYRYVSRLVPTQVLLDERTATGHEAPPGVKPCQFVPWREIQSAVKTGGIGWADVMDFYARHNCDEYSFWEGYHRWKKPGTLPSHAP